MQIALFILESYNFRALNEHIFKVLRVYVKYEEKIKINKKHLSRLQYNKDGKLSLNSYTASTKFRPTLLCHS